MASLTEIDVLELTGTCLENVTPSALARLLTGSRRFEVRAGAAVFPLTDASAHIGIVLMGTARAFVTAAGGRQLTVRYARRGALIGKYSPLSGDHAPLAVQAVSDCTILEFAQDVFTMCAATEISLSSAVVVELAQRLEDVYATVGDSAFGSVRQRLARHLLALATVGTLAPYHVAKVSQRQLADAIGSSREVVARAMAELRLDGLIRTGHRGIELLSVERLVASLNQWRKESPY